MANNTDFNVSVDLSSLGVNDQLSPQIVDAIQGSIETSLAIIRDRWQTSVQNKLNSTRPLYLQGLGFDSIIYPFGNDMFAGAVQLQGKFPNMLEQGFSAFDLKIGFSKSDKKIKKQNGGWYLTIPIRHSTPGSFMYGQAMPKDVYGVAKKLGNRESLSYKGKGDVSWTGYQQKHNKYDGLTRIIKSYQKTSQSQYITFRRVSDKSDPMSWWHPGFEGVKIAESLMPFAEKTFVDILTTNLNGIS